MRAGILDEGKESFKLVLDDIFNEMGRPELTEKKQKRWIASYSQEIFQNNRRFQRKLISVGVPTKTALPL